MAMTSHGGRFRRVMPSQAKPAHPLPTWKRKDSRAKKQASADLFSQEPGPRCQNVQLKI